MTIKEALRRYNKIEIKLLLEHILKKPKEFLFMNPEVRISENRKIRLEQMVKRRQKGEPIAYILGYKDFYGLRFKVDKDVLIPRPETEILVEKTIERLKDLRLKDSNRALRILDVGTGSGCIAVCLGGCCAKIPFALCKGNLCTVFASDISKKALKVAKENAKKHNVKVKFIHSDILACPVVNPSSTTGENIKMSFDIIIANLPYLPEKFIKDLKFEPKTALYAKEKGLFLIHELLSQIAKLEKKPKYIFLEFDPRQKNLLQKLIKRILPKAEAKFYRDLNNFWRVAEVRL
jgi:release factor glutamine methyltransferase